MLNQNIQEKSVDILKYFVLHFELNKIWCQQDSRIKYI